MFRALVFQFFPTFQVNVYLRTLNTFLKTFVNSLLMFFPVQQWTVFELRCYFIFSSWLWFKSHLQSRAATTMWCANMKNYLIMARCLGRHQLWSGLPLYLMEEALQTFWSFQPSHRFSSAHRARHTAHPHFCKMEQPLGIFDGQSTVYQLNMSTISIFTDGILSQNCSFGKDWHGARTLKAGRRLKSKRARNVLQLWEEWL